MKTIVFQGDSITDAIRNRENDNYMGSGYATMVAGELGLSEPNKYKFYNRGISGNRVLDLYARWKTDCLNLKPDYLSILVGINDVWHEFQVSNGIDAKKFENIYDIMLAETIEALPQCRIMLMEPYVIRYINTEENWEQFKYEVELRGDVTRKLAEKYNLSCIALQPLFDEALKKAPIEYWTPDGIHPTSAGHALIARAWIKAFKEKLCK